MRSSRFLRIAVILISFALFSFISPQNTFAQSFYKLAEEDNPGTGAGSGTNQSGNDDTIFIVAGVAAAAIIGYMVYKRSTDSEEDTTSSSSASIKRLLESEQNSFSRRVQKVKDQIPVDISFSVKKPNATIPDRVYSVGLSFRF